MKPKTKKPLKRPDAVKGPAKVFISHHNNDAQIAGLFATMLNKASAGQIKTFRSTAHQASDGFRYGANWYARLQAELKAASFVVCLITPTSVSRPWILFEAGYAMGRQNSKVCGINFCSGSEASSQGPFAQIHNCGDSPEAIAGLVEQILELTDCAQEHSFLVSLAEEFRDQVLSLPPTGQEQDHEPTLRQLFEEVRTVARSIPATVDAHFEKTSCALRDLLKTSYAGTFPHFFKSNVMRCVSSADNEILIACDFPTYGAFSAYSTNLRYLDILYTKAGRGVSVKVVMLEGDSRRALNRVQFGSTSEDWIKRVEDPDFLKRLEEFCDLTDTKVEAAVTSLDVFLDAVAKYQDAGAGKLTREVSFVGELSQLMPIYFWIADDKRAVFSIPTFGTEALEHAFETHEKDFIKALRTIWMQYEKISKPRAQRVAANPISSAA